MAVEPSAKSENHWVWSPHVEPRRVQVARGEHKAPGGNSSEESVIQWIGLVGKICRKTECLLIFTIKNPVKYVFSQSNDQSLRAKVSIERCKNMQKRQISTTHVHPCSLLCSSSGNPLTDAHSNTKMGILLILLLKTVTTPDDPRELGECQPLKPPVDYRLTSQWTS